MDNVCHDQIKEYYVLFGILHNIIIIYNFGIISPNTGQLLKLHVKVHAKRSPGFMDPELIE